MLRRTTRPRCEALYQDILISVTSFFRDPEAFEALKTHGLPAPARGPLAPRAGAHLGARLLDRRGGLLAGHRLRRSSPRAAARRVPRPDLRHRPERRRHREGARRRLLRRTSRRTSRRSGCGASSSRSTAATGSAKAIRDMCVFARHNVLADPPFSRIDLISCRNLLIYLEPVLQQRVMPILHYALKPDGFLWLGSSETIGALPRPVRARGRQAQDLRQEAGAGARRLDLRAAGAAPSARRRRRRPRAAAPRGAPWTRSTRPTASLLARYAPPGVLVNADLDDPAVPRRHRPLPRAGPGQGQPRTC